MFQYTNVAILPRKIGVILMLLGGKDKVRPILILDEPLIWMMLIKTQCLNRFATLRDLCKYACY